VADVEGAAWKRSRGERTGMIYPIAFEAVQWLNALPTSSARATAGARPSVSPSGRNLSAPLTLNVHPWLMTQIGKLSRNHDLAKPDLPLSKGSSTTWCVVGMHSRASSVMAGSVSLTTRQNRLCAASRSVGMAHGSAARTAAGVCLHSLHPHQGRASQRCRSAGLGRGVLALIADHSVSCLNELLP
jgi:hypothetical protein